MVQNRWRRMQDAEDGVNPERHAPATSRLDTKQALPDLRIVPTSALVLHEECDPTRVDRLTSRLLKDGVLRNPPLVATFHDVRYVVLDGANRTSALQTLGVSAIPVQVVDYEDPSVRLEVWQHVLPDSIDLPARLRGQQLPMRVGTRGDAARWLTERAVACYFVAPTGVTAIPTAPSMRALAKVLAQVVGAYKTAGPIHRVMTADLEVLASQYGSIGAVVVFPTFSKREILELADAAAKLPAGVTRHVISGRALRINVPLDVLRSSGSVTDKDQWLRARIHEQIVNDRVRHYPEATFLFDE